MMLGDEHECGTKLVFKYHISREVLNVLRKIAYIEVPE